MHMYYFERAAKKACVHGFLIGLTTMLRFQVNIPGGEIARLREGIIAIGQTVLSTHFGMILTRIVGERNTDP